MSRGSKWLSICLAFGLLCAPLSALPSPSPPSGSVTLSQSEYDQVEAAILSAQESLKRSNEIIESQSKSLKTLSIFCAVLVGVVALDAISQTVFACKLK
jgi:hypothetical protein